jgi:chromate transport protein ChrA
LIQTQGSTDGRLWHTEIVWRIFLMDQTPFQHDNLIPSLFHLFTSFLRLGATAFGGPATVAYIRTMAVEKNHWLDEPSARDGVALCQTIPGATAMQMSAYAGLRARGVAGAAVSFIGFGLPAFLFMMILSSLYARTHTLPAVLSAFNGLQAIVVALVANATLSFGRSLRCPDFEGRHPVGDPNRDRHLPHCFVDDTYVGYRFRGIWGTLTEAVAFVYRGLYSSRHLF